MSNPRLSIVIATYNAAQTLQRCLQSIIGQTFRGWEIIITDGGSTDSTIDILRENATHIAHWQSHPDDGIYDAWNQALGHATGEYITFLGSDDIWHSPDTILNIFDAIQNRPFDLVTGRGHLVSSDGALIEKFGHAWDYQKVTRRMTICHPGALHRRTLFDRFGRFDTSYQISADYDFLLRLPRNLHSLFIDQTIVDVADGGISRDRRWLMLRERYRAQTNCPRIGQVRATINYIDKLWRIPVAKVLGIRN